MNNIRFKRFVPFCVIAIAFCSCNTSTSSFNAYDEEGEVEVIVAPELPEGDVGFQEYVNSVKIIPLETNEESLFRTVSDFVFVNNKFYVFDRTIQELFVFDERGKFLYKLNKRGKGPEEYLEMRDFQIAENGDIHVLSYGKVLIYDSLRRLKATVPFGFSEEDRINPIMFALAFGKGYYLYCGSFGVQEGTPNRYSIYKVDGAGVFTGEAFFPLVNDGPESSRFFKIVGDNSYTLTPILGNDTVYRLSADQVTPHYYLDYGSRKLPASIYTGFSIGKQLFEAAETTNYVTGTYSIIETSDVLSYSFKTKRNICIVFHSKKTGNSFSFPATGEFGTSGFFPRIRTGVGRTFYGHIAPYLLIPSKDNGEFKEEFGYLENYASLEATINTLQESDNPAIMAILFNDF